MKRTVTVALTGAAGNMGRASVDELLLLDFVSPLRVLLSGGKRTEKFKKAYAKEIRSGKIEVVVGNLASADVCRQLVSGAQIVLNLAAVIPPRADQNPAKAVECNVDGVNALVGAIEQAKPQPKLVHISTMALYGNRNERHPWGMVGDPLLVSAYDIYAATKLRGEFRVLESNVREWAVLRQNAMLHDHMLLDNLNDGLMYHTCYNAPLEWVTARDCGRLMARIVTRDYNGELGSNFWGQVFNIGAPEQNRVTGYETLDAGFRLIGGSCEDFFRPNENATRNFHGLWFLDGYKLNDLFGYQNETVTQFWGALKQKMWYAKPAKILPHAVLRKTIFDPLRDDPNASTYWVKHNDIGRMQAYFGGKNEVDALPKDWKDFPLWAKGRTADGPLDYAALKNPENAVLIPHYFDDKKPDSAITYGDLCAVAEAHGGKCLAETFVTGDVRRKVRWQTQDGEVFEATPYTVLRAGHWYNITYREFVWDFDRLARKDKIYASVWYDSHGKNERFRYHIDANFFGGYRKW